MEVILTETLGIISLKTGISQFMESLGNPQVAQRSM